MKKFLLLVLSVLPLGVRSQEPTPAPSVTSNPPVYRDDFHNTTLYSYTIGLKILSFEEFPKIFNQDNTDILRSSVMNGLIFKYNDNQISYRISGGFYSKRVNISNDCENCDILTGRLNDKQIKIGFEKNLIYAVFQPYFGLDLGAKRSVFKGNSASGTLAEQYDAKSEKNGLTVSPVLGFKLNLINHLSIAAESTMDVFYCYERQERAYPNMGNTTSVNKYYKWEYLFKPLGMLSLQYNFGAIY